MDVLIIGSGGREHAIAWKAAQSPNVDRIYVAPGNPGIGEHAELIPVKATDIDGIVSYAKELRPDLTIVGPEMPLSLGVADALLSHGLAVFGPSRAAARIESSKAFSKDLMTRAGVPTAGYEVFHDADAARDAARSWGGPLVVKLDGLAAGKGVVVADSPEMAAAAVDELAAMGGNGARFILEERLSGFEVSVFGISDGTDVQVLLPAQDHKRAYDGDRGPNTGGMGAVAPVTGFSDDDLARVGDTVLLPTIRQLAHDGTPFVGVLFAGLMMTGDGPKVLEFNCRFGDPETEAILPLLETDLIELAKAACRGELSRMKVEFKPKHSVCVVMASPGYPAAPRTGQEIVLPPKESLPDDVTIFHAGTAFADGKLVSAGGRVLAVTAVGDGFEDARRSAYNAVEAIKFKGSHYRGDIGHAESIRR